VTRWDRYVDFWREREDPDVYAVARIVWGLVVLLNVGHQIASPGVFELYALPAEGGVWPHHPPPWWSLFHWFEPTALTVSVVIGANLVAAIGLTAGAFTRFMAFALMIIHMALHQRLGIWAYGGDTLVGVFSFLMVLAPLGSSWSVDALRSGGQESVPSWPRRLVIAQLTLLYVKTGIVKIGSTWTLWGGYSAVYYVLNDQSFARWNGAWSASVYPLTQIATWMVGWWETLFFLLPWNQYLRRPAASGGWLRSTLGRYDLRPLMLGVGACLHLGLFLTLELGLFSWLTLALYPWFLRPDEARRLLERTLGTRWRGVR